VNVDVAAVDGSGVWGWVREGVGGWVGVACGGCGVWDVGMRGWEWREKGKM